MPNTKSARRSVRIAERNRLQNVARKSKMRSFIKNAVSAIDTNSDKKESALREALRMIDKTVTKGIMHYKTAARKKSKLAAKFNAAGKPKAAAAPKKGASAEKKEAKAKSKTTKAAAKKPAAAAAPRKKATTEKKSAKKS